MNRYIKLLAALALPAVLFLSCKKDHTIGGGTSDAYVDMTTYDFLRSNPLFDSLVKIIDLAGMKDAINGNITFFATTNYGVNDFMARRKLLRDAALGDENIPFSIDSLSSPEMHDSLMTYLFEGKINREQMTTGGKLYNSMLGPIPDVQFMIKLRRTYDYSAYVDKVDYVQFTKVIKTRDDQEPDYNAIPENDRDFAHDCQTSGIITKTGIVHVLSGRHSLFFHGE